MMVVDEAQASHDNQDSHDLVPQQSSRYISPTHAYDTLATFKKFREQKLFCDFTITVQPQNVDIHVHKLVMAACSDFFMVMVQGDFIESDQHRVFLKDVDLASIEAIIDFAYTGEIHINEENMHNITIAASILQAKEVERHCMDRFLSQMDYRTCLACFEYTDKNALIRQYDIVKNYCLDKFAYAYPFSQLQELDLRILNSLICDENLRCKEYKIFEAVMKWISHDVTNRSKHLYQLIRNIRFPLMTPKYLCQKVLPIELIKNCQQSSELVNKAIQHLSCWKNRPIDCPSHPYIDQPLSIQPRKCFRQRICAFGGWDDGKPIQSIEVYDFSKKGWLKSGNLDTPCCGIGSVVVDGFIYIIGGHDGQAYLKTIAKYNVSNQQIEYFSMKHKRTSVSAIAVNEWIYILGGQFGRQSLNLVCKYNHFTKEWVDCAPLLTPRLGAAVACVNNRIYVIGGGTPPPDNEDSYSTVECYDIETNEWSFVKSMKNARKHSNCIVYDDIIYVVGGRDNKGHLRTAECYDPETDTWTAFPSMKMSRSGLGLVCVGNLIYAVGGYDGKVYHSTVEFYDLTHGITGEWKNGPTMQFKRLGAAVVTYEGIY